MSLDDAQLMIELAGDYLHLARIVVEMLLLAGHFEMAAAGEVAIDGFFSDDLLDAINGLQRRGVHAAGEIVSVHGDELVHAQLHAGQNHTAVAGTGSPADGFGFEDGNFGAALGESAGGGEAGEAGADYGYVRTIRERAGV